MADDFCNFFDAMIAKYTLKPIGKRKYHRNSTMSKAEVMLIMILFHDSGYRCFKHFYLEKVCKHLRIFTKLKSNMKGALMSVSDRLLLRKRAIIETVNDELKNIAQVEHSRYRCFDNLVMSEKVCKILLVLSPMLGVPQAWGKFVMLISLCHFT